MTQRALWGYNNRRAQYSALNELPREGHHLFMKHMPIHLKLFLVFFKIGLFTFGGGYAMIPLIHRETVEGNQWIDDETMLNMLAIAESTPGPVAINSATFIGHRVAGFWGAPVSYTHLRAHETGRNLVCRLLLEKKKRKK